MKLSAEIYLLLAVISSASMALVLKALEKNSGNRYAVLLGNYLTCVLMAAAVLPDKKLLVHPDVETILCGGTGGVFFVAGLAGMQGSIRVNGAILTSAFSRLGLLVPLFVSIVFFGERPDQFQLSGLLMVLAAMWLISGEKKTGKRIVFPLLFMVLVFCGSGDAMAKIFERVGNRSQDELYIFFVFLTAAALTVILLFREQHAAGLRPALRDFLAGIAVGIPNYFSSLLLLKALLKLPAFIVYPCFSTGAIVLVTLVSALLFGERPGKRQWTGLGMIMAALVLLNI